MRRSRDRHGRNKRHGECLEHQREAGALARPRHVDLADAALGSGDARNARGEERQVLEEVEMPRRVAARLRHDVFSAVSCTGQPSLPQSGHAKREPTLKSTRMSSRFLPASKSDDATNQGEVIPRASWKRSLSRLWHPEVGSILAASVPPRRPALIEYPLPFPRPPYSAAAFPG